MHYALCIMNAISHCPTVGLAQTLCIMRFMHYELMHYEIVYCNCKAGDMMYPRLWLEM